MSKLFLVFLLISSVFAYPSKYGKAECELPDCYCSSSQIPGGLEKDETPQFVMLTFDDAVTISNINFYRDSLYNRENPDSCPASSTFFVAHRYTDYAAIHELHANANEIATHSITHSYNVSHWKDEGILEKEFADHKQTFQRFSNINSDEIKGTKLPLMGLGIEDELQKMMSENDLLYDMTINIVDVSRNNWPYTRQCAQTEESYPNVWRVPVNVWDSEDYSEICAMVDGCVNTYANISTLDWMKREFHAHYDGDRSPFNVALHAAWFLLNETHFEAYVEFLDYIDEFPDVFIVNPTQLIEWLKNPKTVEEMKSDPICARKYIPTCTANTCPICDHYMSQCSNTCPNSYPWLGNPVGDERECAEFD